MNKYGRSNGIPVWGIKGRCSLSTIALPHISEVRDLFMCHVLNDVAKQQTVESLICQWFLKTYSVQ